MIRAATVANAVPRRADSPAVVRAFFSRRRLRGSIAPSAVNALASAIQTHEGYFPGSPAYRNNNPGNLVYVGQAGATPGSGGFAAFSSYDAGLSALKAQINLDASRGTDAAGRPINTVSDLISSWAPSSDPRNNTPAYIAAVASQTGYDPDAPLSSLGSGVPTFSVDVWGTPDASGSASPAPLPSYDNSGGGFDLASASTSGLDVSALFGQPVSISWAWLGLGIVAALALARR